MYIHTHTHTAHAHTHTTQTYRHTLLTMEQEVRSTTHTCINMDVHMHMDTHAHVDTHAHMDTHMHRYTHSTCTHTAYTHRQTDRQTHTLLVSPPIVYTTR